MLICEEIGYIASIVPRNFAKTALKIEKGRGRGIKYEPKMLRLWCVFSEKPEQEVFRCGARIFYFSNQNEKVYAPRFSGAQTQRNRFVNEPGITRCALSLYVNL